MIATKDGILPSVDILFRTQLLQQVRSLAIYFLIPAHTITRLQICKTLLETSSLQDLVRSQC